MVIDISHSYPVGDSSFQIGRHLRFLTAKIIVVGVGSLIGIIKIGHVAIVIDPNFCVTIAQSTSRNAILTIDARCEAVP